MGTQKVRKTQEEFEKNVFDLVGDEFKVIGEYKNNKTKIRFQHKLCGREFEMKPSNFLYNGQRCSLCNSNFGKITLEIAKEKFLEKHLLLLEDTYINSSVKMKYKCLKCGCQHEMRYEDVVRKNHGCAGCSKNKKLTFNEIKNKIESEKGYSLLSEKEDFKNVHSKLRLKHSCGISYSNSYNNFRNGQRCPVCAAKASSKGLSKNVINIIEYLIESKINFEIEKKFDDLKITSRKGRYDFYFENKNLLVEYQGKQHRETKPSPRFTEKKLEQIKESDALKKEYALNHGFNIEYILDTEDEIQRIKEILLKYKTIKDIV